MGPTVLSPHQISKIYFIDSITDIECHSVSRLLSFVIFGTITVGVNVILIERRNVEHISME